jgi:BASS family bile acid:Na+ symporter
VASAVLLLAAAWQPMVSLIGNGTLAAFIGFCLVGLFAGHLLGGPASENRTVLATATAARHPGIAIAVVHANFPGAKLAPAAVLLFLIVNAIVSGIYLAWRKRHPPTLQVAAHGGSRIA